MDGHASGSQLGVIKIVEAIPGYWGGGVRGRDSVAARRSLTPNALANPLWIPLRFIQARLLQWITYRQEFFGEY